MKDCGAVECAGIGIAAIKCLFCHKQEARWRESEAEIVVEEEIVEYVWTYKIFRFLLDIAVFIGRNQFRTNWSVDDVEKSGATVFIHIIRCDIADEMADESLGNAGVYSIHRHVVAVVCRPSKGEFAKVASTDNHTVYLICIIHKNLCALASLTILVCHIMHRDVVTDILEMLCDTFGDGNLDRSDTERSHQ